MIFNFLDFIIIIAFVFYAVEGYVSGFLGKLFDFISLLLSFILGLKFYSIVGLMITQAFLIPSIIGKTCGFLLIFFLTEIIIMIFVRRIFFHGDKKILIGSDSSSDLPMGSVYLLELNHFAGLILGFCSSIIIVTFFLTFLVSIPFSSLLRRSISQSIIGNRIIIGTQGVEGVMKTIFGGAVNETLNFLTTKTDVVENIDLGFTTIDVVIDIVAEKNMLELINNERKNNGLNPLVMNEKLRIVAQNQSRDMFANGYFSHTSLNGLTPFDRLRKMNISYKYAGENLALAPSAEIAMQGLMNSKGHRASILSPNFKQIGIGAINGGIYEVMFSQEFTD
ncbi:hypothetical protein LBMAG33_5230 [Candidatus Levyibacteriota bacterium]|nr:CvpA family protein [Candidatus Levybacteria bacterium]GDX62213.1 hypothetical protein LBMAG33_5230 [Candidatus Levybacteria bacterium]